MLPQIGTKQGEKAPCTNPGARLSRIMSRHEIAAGTAGADRYGMDGDADGMFTAEELAAHHAHLAAMKAQEQERLAAQAAASAARQAKFATLYETVPGFAERRGFNGFQVEHFQYGKHLVRHGAGGMSAMPNALPSPDNAMPSCSRAPQTPEEVADRDTPGTSPDNMHLDGPMASIMARPPSPPKDTMMAPRGRARAGEGFYQPAEGFPIKNHA